MQLRDPPIVVGGCGRSGTTLLLSILSAHPHIFAIPKQTGLLCPTAYTSEPDLTRRPRVGRLTLHLLTYELPPTIRRWCEKTPRNVLFFGPILSRMKNRARLIHLVRDGRDVITSRHPSKPDTYWVEPDRWIEDVAAGLRYRGHPQVLTLRYEDLVTDLERALAAMGHFLEEDFSALHSTWHENASIRSSHNWTHDVKDVHAAGIGRWNSAEHMERVDEFLRREEAIVLLKEFGYEV